MNGKQTGFLVISQILLLIAYFPLTIGLVFLVDFARLPLNIGIDLFVALAPLLLVLSPMIYGALQAKGPGGPIGLFVASYSVVMTATFAVSSPYGFSILPVLLPVMLIKGIEQAPMIGQPSLIIAIALSSVVTILLWKLKRRKLALAALPPIFMLVLWLSAEGLFSYFIPKAAAQQFGADYCLTDLGSAAESLKYGGTLSMYRHANVSHQGKPFHWSFKAKAFVPEDHWGLYGPEQNECTSGSHYAKNYKHW